MDLYLLHFTIILIELHLFYTISTKSCKVDNDQSFTSPGFRHRQRPGAPKDWYFYALTKHNAIEPLA